MARKQPFTFAEFKEIYSKVPKLCVDLIIKTDKGILLTFRTKNGWQNQWHLPGGTVFYREPAIEAVKRIAKEELDVAITSAKFINFIEWPNEIEERGFGYTVSLVFLCTIKNSGFKLDDQVEKAEFFQKIPKNTVYEHKIFLKKLASIK
jgi:ADP-ribose pyrophosphatase YjhB (NUDIX family)